MTDDESAIRQVVETWMAATKRRDLAAVLTLMTDDMIFMVPAQEPFGKGDVCCDLGKRTQHAD